MACTNLISLSDVSRTLTWQLPIWCRKWKGTLCLWNELQPQQLRDNKFHENGQANKRNDKWLCTDLAEIPLVMHIQLILSLIILELWAKRVMSCQATTLLSTRHHGQWYRDARYSGQVLDWGHSHTCSS